MTRLPRWSWPGSSSRRARPTRCALRMACRRRTVNTLHTALAAVGKGYRDLLARPVRRTRPDERRRGAGSCTTSPRCTLRTRPSGTTWCRWMSSEHRVDPQVQVGLGRPRRIPAGGAPVRGEQRQRPPPWSRVLQAFQERQVASPTWSSPTLGHASAANLNALEDVVLLHRRPRLDQGSRGPCRYLRRGCGITCHVENTPAQQDGRLGVTMPPAWARGLQLGTWLHHTALDDREGEADRRREDPG